MQGKRLPYRFFEDWKMMRRLVVTLAPILIAGTLGCAAPDGGVALTETGPTVGTSLADETNALGGTNVSGESPIRAVSAIGESSDGSLIRLAGASDRPEIADAESPETRSHDSVGRQHMTFPIEPVPIEPVPIRPVPVEPMASEVVPAADSTPVTLEELESVALSNHPAIASDRARVSAARGRQIQAGLPPNPIAQYNGEEMGTSDTAGLHSMMIGQTYVTANKLGLRQGVVAAEVTRANAELEATRQRVLTDVRTAFARALVAQRRLELVDRLLEVARQSTETVEAMWQAEEVSRIELLQAQTEVERAAVAVESAKATRAGERRRLATVVSGDRSADSTTVGDRELEGDLDDALESVSWDSTRDSILRGSPELASRVAAIERARRSVTLASAEIVPDVTVYAGAGYDAGSNDTFGTVQVSVPLPLWDRNQGNRRRALADLNEASNRLRQKELDLGERLAVQVQAYETARLQSERIRREIVPRAEETLRLTRDAFEAGETSFLQLLTAQRTLFEARLDELEFRRQAAETAARIGGNLLEGGLADR